MMQFPKQLIFPQLRHYPMHCRPGEIPEPLGGYGPYEKFDDYLRTHLRFRDLRRVAVQRHAGQSPGIHLLRRIQSR